MNAIPLMTVIWVAAMILFAALEAVTIGALVSIWFALGALAALIVSCFTPNFWVQLAVFLVVSCVASVSYTHLPVGGGYGFSGPGVRGGGPERADPARHLWLFFPGGGG